MAEQLKQNIASADQTTTVAMRDATHQSAEAAQHAASTSVDLATAVVDSIRESMAGAVEATKGGVKVSLTLGAPQV
jgi:hypothetical protein